MEAEMPVKFRTIALPRRKGLSYREFVQDHVVAKRPVILTDAIPEWKALARWSPEFFRSEFGSVETRVGGEKMSVREVVDGILHADGHTPAPYLHTTSRGGKMQHLFPELIADIRPLPKYSFPNWLEDRHFPPSLDERLHRGPQAELFLGGAGGRFSLHWDTLYFQVFAFQVYGTKLWYLFGPNQSSRVYPREELHSVSLIEDVERPDLERFPLFADAVCHACTLAPGEMLYMPGGWWHTTRIQEPSISVSINAANSANWSRMSSEICEKLGGTRSIQGRAFFAYLIALMEYKSLRDRIARPLSG